jgi:mRNA interferase RelE/StbE
MTGSYELRIRRSAEKEIRALPRDVRRRVIDRIRRLPADTRPAGCEKLAGVDAFRIRVGAYRIVYTISDRVLVVEVVRVAHRREVYR